MDDVLKKFSETLKKKLDDDYKAGKLNFALYGNKFVMVINTDSGNHYVIDSNGTMIMVDDNGNQVTA